MVIQLDMVDEIRNKVGRKLFQRTSQRQVQYHKESKLWIPHRKRVYLYWFKFLQIAEQDTKRKVNWKKYKGWGDAKYILGVKNFDVFWNDKWKELFGLKTIKDIQRFPISTSKPKIENIRTSWLVYQKLHLKSYLQIAKEIQESELKNRTGVKDFKNATDETITDSGVYNTDTHTIKPDNGEKGQGIDLFEKRRNPNLSPALIREKIGDDDMKMKQLINAEVNKKVRAEKKSILFKAVSSYIKTSESILDGVCEGKFPETPDMRSKETFVRGEGKRSRKSNYYSPSKLESAEEYVDGLHQRLKDDDANEIKLKKQEETDDFNKMKKYNAGHKTPEERFEEKEYEMLRRLVEDDDETSIYGRRQ